MLKNHIVGFLMTLLLYCFGIALSSLLDVFIDHIQKFRKKLSVSNEFIKDMKNSMSPSFDTDL